MKAELIIDAPIVERKDIWVKKIHKPHFDHPFHFHQVCELVWVQQGYGKMIIGDYIGNFSDGELILHGTGLPHLWQCDKVYYNQTKLQTKALTLYFSSQFILNISDDATISAASKKLLTKAQRGLRIKGNTRKIILEHMAALEHSIEFERLSHFLSIVHTLNHSKEYDYLASVSYKSSKTEFDLNRFTEVYQFLLNNFQRDIMLEEVAEICNLTPNAFCRYFKSKTQKTLSRFLNELRIGHACKLLQNEAATVDNICYECGYNTPVNFFKFFKLITRKTPNEYRKEVLGMKKHNMLE